MHPPHLKHGFRRSPKQFWTSTVCKGLDGQNWRQLENFTLMCPDLAHTLLILLGVIGEGAKNGPDNSGRFQRNQSWGRQSHKNMALHCLLAAAESQVDLLTLDEALEKNALAISEVSEWGIRDKNARRA